MTIETTKHFLFWCLVLNYSALLWWFLAFRFGSIFLYWFQCRWFQLSKERFDEIHYTGMATYKIGILLFNLAPYLALIIVDHTGGWFSALGF